MRTESAAGGRYSRERRKTSGRRTWSARVPGATGLEAAGVPAIIIVMAMVAVLSAAIVLFSGTAAAAPLPEGPIEPVFGGASAGAAAEGATPGGPATATVDSVNVYDQTDTHIVYSGATSLFTTPSAYLGSYTRLSAGAAATIWFEGTRLDWVAMKGLTTGPARVYVDDDPVFTVVDLRAASPVYQVTVWTSGDLPWGLHKVRIEWNATSGKYVTLDRLVITGTITPAPPAITGISPSIGPVGGGESVALDGTALGDALGDSAPGDAPTVTFAGLPATAVRVNPAGTHITCTTPAHEAGTVTVEVTTPAGTAATSYTYLDIPALNRYDQTHAEIVKTGSWADFPTTKAYLGDYGRSQTAGASATIHFNGVRLDWIAMKGTTTGLADVYVDGAFVTTVNLAAPVPVYQVAVWSTGLLLPGEHTVTIVRNKACPAGKYLTLDAVDVYGSIVSTATGDGPLIVIDPGHSGTSLITVDPATHIQDYEYNNNSENAQVWAVSLKLKTKLEAAGYRVRLTKDGPLDTVSKRTRTDLADENGAALAVSIHRDAHTFGAWGQVYVQRTDGYRGNIYGENVYFDLPDVAAKSLECGLRILAARQVVEGPAVVMRVNTFDGRTELAPGNLPLVQLFSKTPWVYCEAGVPDTEARQDKYAQGIFDGIMAAVPVDGGAPAPLPVPDHIRYEQTDPRIVKAGAWTDFGRPEASDGSYGRSLTNGAAAVITFTGSRLDWIGMKGTTTGYARVYLDGVLVTPAPLDLAASKAAYQLTLWSSGDLGLPAPHTVRIERYVYPNGTGRDKYLPLDAVDIWEAIDGNP